MDILISMVLGAVQGATEFLPISSSGHLILVREVLGINTASGLAYDAVLQLATALAVLVYFRKDFFQLLLSAVDLIRGREVERTTKVLLYAIVIGTIPAAILGLLLQDYMETTFRTPLFVSGTLVLGSLLFLVAEKVARQSEVLSIKKGLGIGFFQSLALFPGTSRSGATIAGGLIFGLTRAEAARFSFLLSFPIIFGSGLVKMLGLAGAAAPINMELFVGAIAAFIVGIAAIHFLLQYLRRHTLMVFIWYRIALAALVVFLVV